MTYLLLQTFLLLLSSYFFGAFVACLAKRAVSFKPVLETVPVSAAVQQPVPAQIRTSQRAPATAVRTSVPAVAPRHLEPVQPRIDILARPAPKAQPKSDDTSRFDRALAGPDPNAGMPRRSIIEIRPAILTSPTGPAHPWPPPKPPAPVKPVVAAPAPAPALVPSVAPSPKRAAPAQQQSPQGTSAATAAAAAAVAAAKAAAAAAAAVTPQLRTSQPATAPAPVPSPIPSPIPAAPAQPAAAALQPPMPAPPKPVAPPPAAAASTPPAPKAAEPLVQPAPAPVATSAPTAIAAGGDDFQRIRAIDAETEQKLKSNGVKRFEDMARWVTADVNRINQALGLTGRIDREQWIEQAQILAKGGETYYSRNRASALRSAPAPGLVPVAKDAVTPAAAATATPATPAPTVSSATVAPPAPQAAAPPVAPAPVKAPATPAVAPPVSTYPPPGKKSVADMASAAAAAIAAASASVTRGVRPIEPISPLSKADPKIVMAAKLSDAIKEKEIKDAGERGQGTQTSPAKPEGQRSAVDDVDADDLKRIRGIGVLIEKRLNAMGVVSYEQIANWTNADIDRVSQTLDFKGRVERENWVEQARILSSGGHTEFSRRVDKGDVETSRDD